MLSSTYNAYTWLLCGSPTRVVTRDAWPVTRHRDGPGYSGGRSTYSQSRVGEAQVHRRWRRWTGTMYVCYHVKSQRCQLESLVQWTACKSVTHLTGVHASMQTNSMMLSFSPLRDMLCQILLWDFEGREALRYTTSGRARCCLLILLLLPLGAHNLREVW